jgi:hypothetical protein
MTADEPHPPAADEPQPPAADEPQPSALSRGRRTAVRALFAVATLLGILAVFAVWANRQALDEDNWASTSSSLLSDPAIKTQVASFLVDQVYANVDVNGEVRRALPPRLAPLAGPAANGVRTLAERSTRQLLGRPRVQQAWEEANRLTARQFINIAEGKSGAITASGNAVILDLRPVLETLIVRLGLPRSLAQKVPPSAGKIKILESSQVSTLQDGVRVLRGLAVVLPLLAVALFALAVFLARGQRRRELAFVGVAFIFIGTVVLIARHLIGRLVVDALATTDAVRPATEAAWSIGTSTLRDVAGATIVVGVPLVAAAWLAGPTRPAVGVRRVLAPWLRERPGVAYGVVTALVLLVIAWGPIPATQQVVPVIILIALVVLGMVELRRQTAREFPDADFGETGAALRRQARRLRPGAEGVRPRGTADAAGEPAPAAADGGRLERLERLTALHDAGALTDDEFASEKSLVLAGDAEAR